MHQAYTIFLASALVFYTLITWFKTSKNDQKFVRTIDMSKNVVKVDFIVYKISKFLSCGGLRVQILLESINFFPFKKSFSNDLIIFLENMNIYLHFGGCLFTFFNSKCFEIDGEM